MNKLIFSGLLLILFGCVTKPVQIGEQQARLIQTKAKVSGNGQSQNLTIEIALLPQKAVRMEVSATLGVSVATVLMKPDQIIYALHRSNEFISGGFNKKTLYPVFKQEIDPIIFWKVIHGQSPQSSEITCYYDEQKKPTSCYMPQDSITMNWTYISEESRKIDIKSPNFDMSWIIKSEGPLTTDQNETFVLNKPDNYKEFIIK
jgi:Domain of unknown function (DUF4292)